MKCKECKKSVVGYNEIYCTRHYCYVQHPDFKTINQTLLNECVPEKEEKPIRVQYIDNILYKLNKKKDLKKTLRMYMNSVLSVTYDTDIVVVMIKIFEPVLEGFGESLDLILRDYRDLLLTYSTEELKWLSDVYDHETMNKFTKEMKDLTDKLTVKFEPLVKEIISKNITGEQIDKVMGETDFGTVLKLMESIEKVR